jgi:hypothetical protein
LFVLLIVSGIFTLFGLFFCLLYLYFKRRGRLIPAKIFAIERYQSTTNHQQTTLYRPLIKYNFKGQSYIFSSSFGSSNVSHKIGQEVKVISLETGPEFVRLKTPIQWLLPFIFFAVGVTGAGIYFTKAPSNFVLTLYAITLILIPYGILRVLRAKGLVDQFFEEVLKTRIEDKESLEGRKLFKDQKMLKLHLNRSHTFTFAFTAILTLGSIIGSILCWKKILPRSKSYIFDLPGNMQRLNELEIYLNDRNLLLFLIMMFFSFVFIYSLIYQQLKK